MGDVNHKYPKTTIPNTIIAVVMIPAIFFLLTNAIAVMIINSTYTIANQTVNPIFITYTKVYHKVFQQLSFRNVVMIPASSPS